jgi:hypothetical protein
MPEIQHLDLEFKAILDYVTIPYLKKPKQQPKPYTCL